MLIQDRVAEFRKMQYIADFKFKMRPSLAKKSFIVYTKYKFRVRTME